VAAGSSPYTLANFGAGFSPFPGGDLILSFNYSQTYDTLSNVRARNLGPYLRWDVSRAAYLELSYNLLETSSPVQDSTTRALSAKFTLTL
jgi:hypothetical protein